MIPFSLLDLAPIADGHSVGEVLHNTRRMAVRAEERFIEQTEVDERIFSLPIYDIEARLGALESIS